MGFSSPPPHPCPAPHLPPVFFTPELELVAHWPGIAFTMVLSDAHVQKLIKPMTPFAEEEANGKAEETDARAAEFDIEKGRLVRTQRPKVTEYRAEKGKRRERQERKQVSGPRNRARLQVLGAGADLIPDLPKEATQTRRGGKGHSPAPGAAAWTGPGVVPVAGAPDDSL